MILAQGNEEVPVTFPEKASHRGAERDPRDDPGRPAILSGWGRHPVISGREIRPSSPGELASALARPYLPRGLGRSYGDASLPAPGRLAISSGALDRFLSFDPASGILEAEAGVTLERILRVFVPKGFFLPVTPGTTQATLGGALASNVHGKNHHVSGSIERFVEDLEVAAPAGTFTCSAKDRPDLFRATVGGYGLTGFITRARLRLKPIRSSRVDVLRVRARGLDDLFRLFATHDAGYEYSVAWLDTLAKGKALGRGILMLGGHEVPKEGARLDTPARPGVKVPFPMPASLLNPVLLAAFNGAFYRFSKAGGPAPEDFASFFYPLDRIRDWNLLYGPGGFFQYQCALPDPGEDGVAACLDFLSRNGLGAFLSVLKRCGDDGAMIPFCRRGYTLALDIPFRGGATLELLDRLDELVLKHGGRVYLTKDARLSKERFRAMYPEWRAWMETVARYNPPGARHASSRMAERLGLWEP